MFCKNCGKEINGDLKFCGWCGSKSSNNQVADTKASFTWKKFLITAIIVVVIILVSLVVLSTILFLVAPLLQ